MAPFIQPLKIASWPPPASPAAEPRQRISVSNTSQQAPFSLSEGEALQFALQFEIDRAEARFVSAATAAAAQGQQQAGLQLVSELNLWCTAARPASGSRLRAVQAAYMRAAAASASSGSPLAAAAAVVGGMALTAAARTDSPSPAGAILPPVPSPLVTSLPVWVLHHEASSSANLPSQAPIGMVPGLASILGMPAYGVSLEAAVRQLQLAATGGTDMSSQKLAEVIAARLRELQPSGPYLILGCGVSGCIAAFEVACVLQSHLTQPQAVMLVLLDGPPSLSEGGAGATGVLRHYDPLPSMLFELAQSVYVKPSTAVIQPLPSSFSVFAALYHNATVVKRGGGAGVATPREFVGKYRPVNISESEWSVLVEGTIARAGEAGGLCVSISHSFILPSAHSQGLMRRMIAHTATSGSVFTGPTAILLPDDPNRQGGSTSGNPPGSAHWDPSSQGWAVSPQDTLDAARQWCRGSVTPILLDHGTGACLATHDARAAVASSLHEAVQEMLLML